MSITMYVVFFVVISLVVIVDYACIAISNRRNYEKYNQYLLNSQKQSDIFGKCKENKNTKM